MSKGRPVGFSITLLFRKFQVDPDVISQGLDLKADVVQRIGVRQKLKNGNVLPYASHINAWSYIENFSSEDDFGLELSRFVEQLRPFHEFVEEIVKQCEWGAYLIVRVPGDDHSSTTVQGDTLRYVADLGLRLGFEVFP